jgi:predicted secreted protein
MREGLVAAGLAAVVLAVTSLAVGAQESAKPEFNVVSLQAHATSEAPNDQIVAVLAAEADGADPAALSQSVNRRMTQALAAAKAEPAVKSRSGNYQTFPVYRDGRIESWRVTQELRLESGDFAAAARLIGRLQKDLVVRGMSVGLSAEARRAAEDALIADAVAAFHARAAVVRAAMKSSGYRIRSMDINAGAAAPPRPFAAGVARAQVAPAVEPGASQVTVTITGTIQLQ